MENTELKKNCIKNSTSYYFNYIIKSEDLIFSNILIDEKPFENSLIYDI